MESADDDEGWLRLMEVSTLCCLPLAMKAAINLGVFDILLQHSSSSENGSKELSALEIVSRMREAPPSEHAASTLDRILRLLASHSILTSSSTSALQDEGVEPTTCYGPTPMCKYLAREQVAPLFLLRNDQAFLDAWHYLPHAVQEGAQPFARAHATDSFAYARAHPAYNALFNSAMASRSRLHIAALLRCYPAGFLGVSTLVDVGGGLGITSSLIVSQWPHIAALNFDLPHVIEAAPPYPGVQHVGGNMFEKVPKGEACFLKLILHDWDDDNCIKLLKNCFDALPPNGKVIVVDTLLTNSIETSLRARVAYQIDLQMLVVNQGGKERTEEEIRCLAKVAGFTKTQLVCSFYELGLIELHKC